MQRRSIGSCLLFFMICLHNYFTIQVSIEAGKLDIGPEPRRIKHDERDCEDVSITLVIYGSVNRDASVAPGCRLPRAGRHDDGVSVWSSGEHDYVLFDDFTLESNPIRLN